MASVTFGVYVCSQVNLAILLDAAMGIAECTGERCGALTRSVTLLSLLSRIALKALLSPTLLSLACIALNALSHASLCLML